MTASKLTRTALVQRIRQQRIFVPEKDYVAGLIQQGILKPGSQNVSLSKMRASHVNPSAVHRAELELKQALFYAQAVSAFDAEQGKPGTVSGKLTVSEQMRRIGSLGRKTLEDLGQTPNLRAEESALLIFRDRVIQRLNGGKVTPQIFFECIEGLIPEASRSDARVALHGGSFSPYTLGHNRLSQSALLDTEVNGVLVLAGGAPPEKDFVLADNHREAMVALGLADNPYLHYSPIRIQMAELFKDTSLGGKNKEEERRLRDLAAFAWAISMNPHLQVEYFVTGADKVNGYGISGKNERELVWETLVSHDVKLLTYNRKDEAVTLFDNEEAHCQKHGGTSWVLDNRATIEASIVVVPETAAFNTSATAVRKMASSHDPMLYDHVPERIADYIYEHGLELAFALENEHDALCKAYANDTKAGTLTPEKIADYTQRLKIINQQRQELYKQGVLAHAKDCTFVRRK